MDGPESNRGSCVASKQRIETIVSNVCRMLNSAIAKNNDKNDDSNHNDSSNSSTNSSSDDNCDSNCDSNTIQSLNLQRSLKARRRLSSAFARLCAEWRAANPDSMDPFVGYDGTVFARRLAYFASDSVKPKDQIEEAKRRTREHHRLGELVMRPHSYSLLLTLPTGGTGGHFRVQGGNDLRVRVSPGVIRIKAFAHNHHQGEPQGHKCKSQSEDEDDKDSGYVTGQLYREYRLPHPIRPETAQATWLPAENLLLVEAQRMPIEQQQQLPIEWNSLAKRLRPVPVQVAFAEVA